MLTTYHVFDCGENFTHRYQLLVRTPAPAPWDIYEGSYTVRRDGTSQNHKWIPNEAFGEMLNSAKGLPKKIRNEIARLIKKQRADAYHALTKYGQL